MYLNSSFFCKLINLYLAIPITLILWDKNARGILEQSLSQYKALLPTFIENLVFILFFIIVFFLINLNFYIKKENAYKNLAIVSAFHFNNIFKKAIFFLKKYLILLNNLLLKNFLINICIIFCILCIKFNINRLKKNYDFLFFKFNICSYYKCGITALSRIEGSVINKLIQCILYI